MPHPSFCFTATQGNARKLFQALGIPKMRFNELATHAYETFLENENMAVALSKLSQLAETPQELILLGYDLGVIREKSQNDPAFGLMQMLKGAKSGKPCDCPACKAQREAETTVDSMMN